MAKNILSTYERHEVRIARDEHHHIQVLVRGQVIGFQRHPDVDAFFFGRIQRLVHGVIVRHDAGVHQDLVLKAVHFQLLDRVFHGLHGFERKAAPEKVCFGDFAKVGVAVRFQPGHARANEVVQSVYRKVAAALVAVFVMAAKIGRASCRERV